MYDIITFGGITRDIFFVTARKDTFIFNTPDDLLSQKKMAFEFGAKIIPSDARFAFGGGGLNTAVAASRLGLRTAIVSSVGFDVQAIGLREYMRKEHIDLRFLSMEKKLPTGLSVVVAPEKERDRTIFAYRGANGAFRVARKKMPQARWTYLTSLGGEWKTSLRAMERVVRDHTGFFAWNPGGAQIAAGGRALRSLLRLTDVLIVNRDEATELEHSARPLTKAPTVRHLLHALHAFGPRIVVLTEGREGSWAYDGEATHHQSIINKSVVDATGAGDATGASFVSGLHLYQGDIRKALYLAALNSASVVGAYGAQEGLLTKAHVAGRMQEFT